MQPERTRNWLSIVLPILREGGPIVSLRLLLIGTITVWWLIGALNRSQEISRVFYEKLITCLDKQVDLARNCTQKD
jgi:hypothetical protein